MLITRECDYAVRAVRALAEGEKKSVKEICDIEHVPQQYAYKILKKLERAGIVKGSRGVSGGYELCKSLDTFTMLDVVYAVEKELLLNECLGDGYQCPNNHPGKPCNAHTELCRIQKVLAEELSAKTMSEIL